MIHHAATTMTRRVSIRSDAAPRRRRAAAAVLGTVSILAAACAGGDGASPGTVGEAVSTRAPEQAVEAAAAVSDSRPGQGIAAAGGTLVAGEPCAAPGSPGAPATHTIAAVSPDLDRLDEIGLSALVLDPIERIFEAYVSRLNSLGGISGNCFEFRFFEFGFTNPAEEVGAICAEVPTIEPLVMFAFAVDSGLAGCTTLAGQIPTVGLYSQLPEAFMGDAGGLLFLDNGSWEFLLDVSVRNAARAGVLTAEDRVALFYNDDAAAAPIQATMAAVADDLALDVSVAAGVPEGLFGTLAVVVAEQFHTAGGELFDSSPGRFAESLSAMPPEFGEALAAMRGFFLNTATAMRDAGVTAVVGGGADWDAVRNLMRAAEVVGWYPKWVTNDAQIATITLFETPPAQGRNLVQVSSRRAADDPIDGLDRGCLSLRNTGSTDEPFNHRFHTDAWSLLTSICDYLDVIFGAVSRVDGPLTRESFLAALARTDYQAAHGQRVRLSGVDPYGSDSFRVLSADPDCVLNDWGCMRALTDWFEPPPVAIGTGDGAG